MHPVRVSESLRQQKLERFADDLNCGISEHFLGSLVEQKNALA